MPFQQRRTWDSTTHVLALGTAADGSPAWIYTGVAGHADEDGKAVDDITRNQVRIPQAFYDKVMPMLEPGTTLLVTQAPLSAGSTGRQFAVISAAR